MATAFQADAFQNDAFQIGGVDPIPPGPVAPPPYPDRFRGPVKPLGIIGRLALDRQLSDYGFDILISISGLRSETIQIQGESVSGKLLGPVEIQPELTTTIIPDAMLQNGNFVIHIDDLKPEWNNLALIKSGSDDRVVLTIEGPFDYIDSR